MYINYPHPSIRLTGRWDKRSEAATTTTCPGSYIELVCHGQLITLHFDVDKNHHPYPHLWIQIDQGPMIESTVEPYIHIQTQGDSQTPHYIKIIYKSAVEEQHRWYAPLIGKITFKGAEVEAPAHLPEDTRKIIEFVGDSITEGVLIDVDCGEDTQHNRVYMDDACATYAWLTAGKLNLRPRIMGYGAVGTTKAGQGNVPKAALAYPYVYDGCPLNESQPDFILINHGANDRNATADSYLEGYLELLEVVRKINPNSKIICLSAFCGVYPEELKGLIQNFNEKYNDSVEFIDSAGWIPREPLHPMRDGHMAIAERLAEKLRPIVEK